MKYGLFADIHANLEALEATLNDMQEKGITHPVCLGDVVGYGANPVECLELILSLDCPIIKGNHDEAAAESDPLTEFTRDAETAMLWTRQQLTTQQKSFLSDLRYTRQIADFTIVHASLDSPATWSYVADKRQAGASFTYQLTPVCFNAHTHVPRFFMQDKKIQGDSYLNLVLQPRNKYLINVGSVGQPRDRDPRAAYAIYDTEKNEVELRRVEYDIATAQQKILQAGLPKKLAERLSVGR